MRNLLFSKLSPLFKVANEEVKTEDASMNQEHGGGCTCTECMTESKTTAKKTETGDPNNEQKAPASGPMEKSNTSDAAPTKIAAEWCGLAGMYEKLAQRL